MKPFRIVNNVPFKMRELNFEWNMNIDLQYWI
jgi:hypothetical protein